MPQEIAVCRGNSPYVLANEPYAVVWVDVCCSISLCSCNERSDSRSAVKIAARWVQHINVADEQSVHKSGGRGNGSW